LGSRLECRKSKGSTPSEEAGSPPSAPCSFSSAAEMFRALSSRFVIGDFRNHLQSVIAAGDNERSAGGDFSIRDEIDGLVGPLAEHDHRADSDFENFFQHEIGSTESDVDVQRH